MRRPRTQESLATGLARCSKLEEGCVLNRLSKETNLCLEAVKERIAVARLLPNYPDRSSDLSQSMKITTTFECELSRCQGRVLSPKLALFDGTLKPSVRQFVPRLTGKGKRTIKGKKNCPRNDVMAEVKRQQKLGEFATGKTICLNAFGECRD